jgi:pre-mRNA-processing factor SLU7
VTLDKERLAQAMIEERKRKVRGEDDDDRVGKKKKDGHVGGHDVTEEELGKIFSCCSFARVLNLVFAEAYRMTRRMANDPMANYVDSGG